MKLQALIATAMLVAAGAAHAAEPQKWPMVIPAPHGSVILPNERAKQNYDEFRYAAIRRVDNTLYISGVIIGRRENEGRDAAAFKLQVDRGFKRLEELLKSAGATFNDLVRVDTFVVGSAMNEYRTVGVKTKHDMLGIRVGGATVFVTGLMIPNALIEISAIAAIE